MKALNGRERIIIIITKKFIFIDDIAKCNLQDAHKSHKLNTRNHFTLQQQRSYEIAESWKSFLSSNSEQNMSIEMTCENLSRSGRNLISSAQIEPTTTS